MKIPYMQTIAKFFGKVHLGDRHILYSTTFSPRMCIVYARSRKIKAKKCDLSISINNKEHHVRLLSKPFSKSGALSEVIRLCFYTEDDAIDLYIQLSNEFHSTVTSDASRYMRHYNFVASDYDSIALQFVITRFLRSAYLDFDSTRLSYLNL